MPLIRWVLTRMVYVLTVVLLVYVGYQYFITEENYVQQSRTTRKHTRNVTPKQAKNVTPKQTQNVLSNRLNLSDILTNVLQSQSRNIPLIPEVTIVTMYINIGKFQKGDQWTYFTPNLYQRWMKVFTAIENPVVAFFDNVDDLIYFENIRRHSDPTLSKTKTIFVLRSQLWAFQMMDKVSKIFQKPGYPKHLPNTVIPEYSCAMHTKYEVMQIATKVNYFKTQYFAWLDIGLFRSQIGQNFLPPIHIWLPPGFNSSKIAYTEVTKRNEAAKPQNIINANLVWVCGCFFIGATSVMEKWTREYKKATEALLNNYDLMSTDQQVLYIMFNQGHPTIDIQTYKGDGRYDEWFHLGYVCKESGDLLKNQTRNS